VRFSLIEINEALLRVSESATLTQIDFHQFTGDQKMSDYAYSF